MGPPKREVETRGEKEENLGMWDSLEKEQEKERGNVLGNTILLTSKG